MIDFKKYDFDINVITPIHIGSNDLFSSSEYIIDGKSIRKIDLLKFYNSLDSDEQKVFIDALEDEKFSLSNYKFNSNSTINEKVTLKKLKKYNKGILNTSWINPPKPKDEINCGIKSNRLYIPGSSLKGSIKSAILYNLINDDDIPSLVKGNLNIDNCLSSNIINNKAHGSIMRFLQVSDSSPLIETGCVYEVMPFTVKNDSLKESSYQKLYLESIPYGSKLESSIKFNFDKDFYSDLLFNETIKKVLDIEFIKESLFNFSKDMVEYEKDFWNSYNKYDVVDFYKSISLDKDKPLVRLGSNLGFHTKTIFLKVKKYDEKNGTNYLNKIERTLNNRIKFSKHFPKSRKLTYQENFPLGWAQLDFKLV